MQHLMLNVFWWGSMAALALTAIMFGCSENDKRKKQQAFARGKLLYQQHCQNCHKENGKGYERLYPPLNQVPYMQENPKKVACILKYGMNGPLTIKGQSYNLYMPGNQQLSKHSIAQLMTYIYNAWDNEHERFTAEFVKESWQKCDTIVITNQ